MHTVGWWDCAVGLKLPVMYGRMYGASYILYGAAHTCMVRAVLVRAYSAWSDLSGSRICIHDSWLHWGCRIHLRYIAIYNYRIAFNMTGSSRAGTVWSAVSHTQSCSKSNCEQLELFAANLVGATAYVANCEQLELFAANLVGTTAQRTTRVVRC